MAFSTVDMLTDHSSYTDQTRSSTPGIRFPEVAVRKLCRTLTPEHPSTLDLGRQDLGCQKPVIEDLWAREPLLEG